MKYIKHDPWNRPHWLFPSPNIVDGSSPNENVSWGERITVIKHPFFKHTQLTSVTFVNFKITNAFCNRWLNTPFSSMFFGEMSCYFTACCFNCSENIKFDFFSLLLHYLDPVLFDLSIVAFTMLGCKSLKWRQQKWSREFPINTNEIDMFLKFDHERNRKMGWMLV